MRKPKINKDSLNWQAGYHQGLVDRMNDFMEAPKEMLARAQSLSNLRKMLEQSAVHIEDCYRAARRRI